MALTDLRTQSLVVLLTLAGCSVPGPSGPPDSTYSGFTNLGDSAVGISLMMWNGYPGATRRCTLVLRD